MKLRSLKLLMAVILVMQTISFTSVYASEGRVITSIDFTESKIYDTLNNVIPDVRDNEVVYGAYGKGINDASLKLSVGGSSSSWQFIRYNPKLTLENDEYLHIGFEYFREDFHSGIEAQMAFKCPSDASLRYEARLLDHRGVSSSSWFNYARFFNSNDNKVQFKYQDLPGQWHKYDVYFSPNSSNAVVFYDGKTTTKDLGVETNWGGANKYNGMMYLDRLIIQHIGDRATDSTPSSLLLDNVIIETVPSIPESQSFKKMGENFNFDDYMEVFKHREGYGIYGCTYFNGTKDVVNQRYIGYVSQSEASIRLTNNPDKYFSTEYGVFGKPSFDKSAHFTATSDATGCDLFWYYPSVDDLTVNDTAQLTFNVANNNPDVNFRLRTISSVFSDGSTKSANLFVMDSSTDEILFFGQKTGVKWEPYKWYKVDFVIKNSAEGTSVDCYLNGELLLENYANWNPGKVLKDIDKLYIDPYENADFYLDDIFYGRRFENGVYDPTAGYSLTGNNETFINNEEKIIAINSDASVAEFKNLLNDKKYVTVYDSTGCVINKGLMNSASTVKVSNGFGGGVFYNVGYKSDKLAIGDIVFDADAKTLKSQAEVGFGIREDYNAPVAPYPTSGIVIIALYNGDELVECTPVPYSNLTEATPAEAVITNVESVTGKTVKVFVFDAADSITPLVVNKVK